MKTHISRVLRENQTPWEKKFWHILRDRRLSDNKFRRQHKIGKYIVDFCCIKKKLIIELDGGHHNIPEIILRDQERQKYLEGAGYKVLRFWNNEIEYNIKGVIQRIIQCS